MEQEENLKKEVEELGHEASEDELVSMEDGTPAEEPTETELPEDRPEMDENIFPSAE